MLRKYVGILEVLIIMGALAAACAAPPTPEVVEVKVTKIVIEEVEVVQEIEVEVTRIVKVIVTPEPAEASVYATEIAVQEIPLAGPIAERDAEISGMTWYGENLILMPQYPNFFVESGDGFVFSIAKEQINAVLSGESYEPIEPVQIPFTAPDVQDIIPGFEGFESIVFDSDTVYMTIEAETDDGMFAYLVAGAITPDLSGITMDTIVMLQIAAQSGVGNMSDEVILLAGGNLLTMYEANGADVNEAPVAHTFGMDMSEAGTLPLTNIEYRITDATELDDNNRFWMINYFFPGDEDLLPETDPIAEEYGKGPTHMASAGVERLVEFEYSDDGITITSTLPIQLQLMADGSLRNWEGLVRLDESGFLIATDKWPQTILGFVPLPEEE